MINDNEKIFYIIGSIFLGFLIYKKICKYGETGNKCKQKFNQIKITKKNKIHVHHWIIHCILLYFNYFNKNSKYYYIYLGLNIGGIIHGISMYKNWYIIYK